MSVPAVKYASDKPSQDVSQETSKDASLSVVDVRKENILLVDDRPSNLMVYQSILAELDQNVVIANSGEEALKLVLKQEFAVILLDVNMPTMNGFEAASLIRARKRSSRTPIIFLTAFNDETNIHQGYASGAVDFLPTPIVPEVLKAKVRVFIELSQTRRQAALQAEERARREAAEDSARKARFLVKISESLAQPKTQSDLLRALVELPLPHLADISFAWLKETAVQAEYMEWGEANAAPGTETAGLKPSDFPWLEAAAQQAMTSGYMQYVEPVVSTNALLPRLHAAIVFPLAIQGQARGVLMIARKEDASPYLSDEVSIAGDLAHRACVALDNITLVEHIQEADRRKDEFLGMLAHELRNPLGPIYNAVQLLQLIGPKEPRMVELRDIIDRQAKHMGRLIDDLLDATRLAHGKILLRKERCDLAKIIYHTVEDYRTIFSGNHLRLHVQGCETPLWINGDPTRLVQAIGNLLHNANKFTKPGGTVIIRLEKHNGKASVTVSDTGIGIDQKMLPYVFDVFRQAEQGLDRKQGGLGLGLALVKGLTQLHAGEVSAFSAGSGKGSEFSIHLPLEDMEPHAAPSAEVVPFPKAPRQRILLIEDNKDAAASAEMLLHLEGHEVKTAATAQAGLKTARSFSPQVILCDIGLPEMDGYEMVRIIRRDPMLRDAYVIALTGYGREEDQQRARAAGFDLHLTKPIDYNCLCNALNRAGAKTSDGNDGR